MIEVDYVEGEEIKLKSDAYNLAIGAILTNEMSPMVTGICLQKAFLVFIIQILVSGGFLYDYKEMD